LKKAASFGKPPTGRLLEELVAVRGGGGSLQPLSLSPDAIALAENLAPKVGIVTSTLLYFTSAPAVLTAIKNEDMGDLNPLPLAIMSVVSVAWLAYGLSVRDKYVTLSNIAGAVGSIGYVVGILPLLAKDQAQLRLTQCVVLVGAAATLCLWTCLGLSGASSAKISATLGAFASGLFVILTASPLSTIKTVVSTKNSASILGPFTGGQVANTFLWSAYGLAIKDCFVWGPNMVVSTTLTRQPTHEFVRFQCMCA